jgi:hypothetical protein
MTIAAEWALAFRTKWRINIPDGWSGVWKVRCPNR